MTDQELLGRIVSNPRVMAGKPVVAGTRLTVEFIIGLLAHEMTPDDVIREYPGLTREDIRACLLFASKSLESLDFVPSAESA
ncbi:MAG: DUF433 domain-containing protein [Phycisphaerae bacterium]